MAQNLSEVVAHPEVRRIVNAPADQRLDLWSKLLANPETPASVHEYALMILRSYPIAREAS